MLLSNINNENDNKGPIFMSHEYLRCHTNRTGEILKRYTNVCVVDTCGDVYREQNNDGLNTNGNDIMRIQGTQAVVIIVPYTPGTHTLEGHDKVLADALASLSYAILAGMYFMILH
jgi:hypothetical protein